jgi:hypothetical protein
MSDGIEITKAILCKEYRFFVLGLCSAMLVATIILLFAASPRFASLHCGLSASIRQPLGRCEILSALPRRRKFYKTLYFIK